MSYHPREIERVRRVLLAMLSVSPGDREADDCLLSARESEIFAQIARQHRLEPLLHARIGQAVAAWRIPAETAENWKQAYRHSALRALAARSTVIRIAEALDAAKIPYVALKGAWLAWHGYSHPAMRPMRDVDILVAPECLEAAYRALVAVGIAEPDGDRFSPATLAAGLKHLPALEDRSTQVRVELHTRLFEHIEPLGSAALLNRTADLLARRRRYSLANTAVAFLPPTETLLHLAIHSAYEHRFDNGIQVLHDVAALLAREPADWQHFWALAEEGGWTRGCGLILRLAERHLGPQPVEWGDGCGDVPADDILDAAAMMLLQDTELRNDLDVQLQLGAFSGGWAALRQLLARFFPARRVVADFAGKSPDRQSVWLHYPAWLASRIVRTARGAVDQRQRSEVARASAVVAWLEQP